MALDDLLDEHEQGERVRAWLRENALALLGGVVLGLGAIFGWKWWQQQAQDGRVARGQQYEDAVGAIAAGELDAAQAQVAALDAAPYATLGALRLAGAQVEAGQSGAAIETLRQASTDDPALQRVIDLRLARLLLDAGKPEDALARLGEATQPAMLELRGDAQAALGNQEAAREAYLQALDALEADAPQRRLVEIKLASVGGSAPATDDAGA